MWPFIRNTTLVNGISELHQYKGLQVGKKTWQTWLKFDDIILRELQTKYNREITQIWVDLSFHYKCGEQHDDGCSMHSFHEDHSELSPGQSVFIPGKSRDYADKSSTVPQEQHGQPQTMPEAVQPDGFCSGYTTGASVQDWVASLGLNPHAHGHLPWGLQKDSLIIWP